MSATSYMILFVVPGGVFYALSIMINGKAKSCQHKGLQVKFKSDRCFAGLALFIPALGGWPAYIIADKAGEWCRLYRSLPEEVGARDCRVGIVGDFVGYTVKAR